MNRDHIKLYGDFCCVHIGYKSDRVNLPIHGVFVHLMNNAPFSILHITVVE